MISNNSTAAIESSESHHENQEYNQLSFKYLPAYATYLLENKLEEFTRAQLNFSKKIELPLLKHLENFSEDELITLGLINNRQLLSGCIENKAGAYIKNTIAKWMHNQFAFIAEGKLSPEDIVLFNFTYRNIFRQFITGYVVGNEVHESILTEVDFLTTNFETACIKAFFEIQQKLSAQAQLLSAQKEKELEESKKFIEKITDVSPCIITVYNVKSGNYLYLNKGVETVLGYNPGEFYKKSRTYFYSLVHEDDVQMLKQKNKEIVAEAMLQKTTASEKISELKYRLKHKDNSYRWMQTFTTAFTRSNNNMVLEMLNVSIDVTQSQLLTLQLEKINEEIKYKELQHQRMISEVEDYAILLMDKDGVIQTWNRGAEKIKGYKANEIIGKNFRLFYRREDRDKKLPETLLEEATLKGRAQHEGLRLRKDGSTFWGNIVITALHDENNNIIGFSKVTRNLTERKLAEDKLREYAAKIEKHNEELQHINKELDSFTYMASHDLQEPLRKIRTFSNIILSRAQESFSADIENYFQRIITSVTRMQTLIDSLLHYSRAGKTEIIAESVNLGSVINEVKKNLAETIEEKKAIIEYSNLPVLKVQPLQFHQLFFNLIENAIKYSREGEPSKIKIETTTFFKEKKDGAKIQFNRITVTDNGIGFEQEYADSIFKLFQRLHGRSEYAGTGIGLAICKKIVENHNGTIKAISYPGKGSTFIIELPVK